MNRSIMAITSMDSSIKELALQADHRTLVIWAADCAERTLHYFEEQAPEDRRPRESIGALREWVRTGVFSMATVRKASLSAHAAARNMGEYGPARSAARAAGQAMASAHVSAHSIAAARYAATTVRDATAPSEAEAATLRERTWQYHHLLGLKDEYKDRSKDLVANAFYSHFDPCLAVRIFISSTGPDMRCRCPGT